MPEINWALGRTDPDAQQRGYSYADQVVKAAAQQAAGQKVASGDYGGAATDLANSGDIQGALSLQDRQQKSVAAAHDYISRALPVFQAVLKAHAGDPDGGKGAIASAFDQVAPEISQITGHNDQAIASFRQSLLADPQGTLDRVQGMLPVKYQTVGKTLVQQQGSNVTPLFTAPQDAPTGYAHAPDGKGLQFVPGGPADPAVIKRNATERRDVIINNPIPGSGNGGESVALTPEGLTNQVDTYIASRGAILPQFGYGKAGLANRDKFYNQLASSMKDQGITANDIASGRAEYKANSTALGQVSKMRNSVESYEHTVQKNMDLLQGLVAKGAKTGAPIINRWIQAGRAAITGDPDVTAYNTAIQTVVNEYAKVMAGGTGSSAASSDSARAEAAHLLNNAQTPQQVQAAINTMRQEMANRIESLKAQESDLKTRLGNYKPDGGGAPSSNLKAKYGLE